MKSRIAILCVVFGFLSGAVACDAEDVADVRHGARDAAEAAEKRAQEIERQVDQSIDTDGRDD
jgi:hypothetical protein